MRQAELRRPAPDHPGHGSQRNARQHLHSLTRSLEFMLGDRKDEWLAARLDDLDYGDIDGIEAAVRAYPSKA